MPLEYPERGSDMYSVQKELGPNQHPSGDIIEMTSIARLIQLIPQFPSNTQNLRDMTPDKLMEQATSFLINSFLDKDNYQSVY